MVYNRRQPLELALSWAQLSPREQANCLKMGITEQVWLNNQRENLADLHLSASDFIFIEHDREPRRFVPEKGQNVFPVYLRSASVCTSGNIRKKKIGGTSGAA